MRLIRSIRRFLVEVLEILLDIAEQDNPGHGRFYQVLLALQRALRNDDYQGWLGRDWVREEL